MKSFFYLLLVASGLALSATAQPDERDLPRSTLIPHYRLSIGFNSTTVLVFAAPVRPVDRGARDILAMKQPGVDNVLKLKAARRDFAPTNLHVFTADGRIYAFDVTFSDSLSSSRDLSGLVPRLDSVVLPVAILSGQEFNDEQISNLANKMRDMPGHHSLEKTRHNGMTLSVEKIAQAGQLLFLRLRLTDRTNLNYVPGFLRCYIRDRQKAKRTSLQEQDMPTVYQEALTNLPGHSTHRMIVALPAFTLANGKEFILELLEKQGGRSLSLRLRNDALLRARPL